jgi:transketolase
MSGTPAASARLASELRLRAVRYRKRVLETIVAAGGGHTGGDLSCLDILAVLYGGVLKVSPETAADPDRDRFVMSKGHSVEALYVVLADRGFFPPPILPLSAARLLYVSRDAPRPHSGRTPASATGWRSGSGRRSARRRTLLQDLRPAGDSERPKRSNWEASLAAAYRLDNLV